MEQWCSACFFPDCYPLTERRMKLLGGHFLVLILIILEISLGR